MGKVDARKLHRSGKVPITESVKSNIGGTKCKTTGCKVSTCLICKQLAQRANVCNMPADTMRCVVEFGKFEMHIGRLADDVAIKHAKCCRPLDLVPVKNHL